jgi:acetyl-CoA acetyltransferase family protein
MPKDWTIALGETAERVAQQYGISRAEQDAFAVESQRRAQAAIAGHFFDAEIIPVDAPDGKGGSTRITSDEPPRAGVTLEALARMKPAFLKDGTVTAATSSGINDGAAALVVLTADAARVLNQKPLARIVGSAVAGVDPSVMGIGPVPAVRKLLARTGIRREAIDLIELNEAFA